MSIQIRVVGLLASAIVASAASAQTAVEWKVSEGGNGHWYGLRTYSSVVPWDQAELDSRAVGGHLATVLSEAEDLFVFSVADTPSAWQGVLGPWLGGKQVPNSGEPVGIWIWCTGEPWGYSGPDASFPNNGSPPKDENRLHYIAHSRIWNDIPEDGLPEYQGGVRSLIVEWDADCNGDGIVDYGQIKRGQLADENTNGVPDICEASITGVIPPSVPAQGGSSITINGRNFPAQPIVLVGGVAATNVVRYSDSRLTAVTPAVLPGMASVSVNGFTLPDGIYIRPECGSDLDQNGVVDAGDISIILLDFGPCYEPPAALAAPAPTPLLAEEPAQKLTQP